MVDTSESNNDFGSWIKYLIGTASDVYGKTLDAKTTQKANQASAQIAQAEAKNTFKIGDYEVDVTQAAVVGGVAALLLLFAVLMKR